MTQTSDNHSRHDSWATRIALLGFVVAIAAALLLIAAPLGYRAGLWSLRTALLDLPRLYVFYAGIAGAAISLLALIVTAASRRGWAAMAVLGIVIGAGSAYVPWSFAEKGHTLPPINDITTDTANPPAFEAVMPLRDAAHAQPVTYGPDLPALQKQAYSDIAPAHLDKPADQAFAAALDTVRKKGWTSAPRAASVAASSAPTRGASGTISRRSNPPAARPSSSFSLSDVVAMRLRAIAAGGHRAPTPCSALAIVEEEPETALVRTMPHARQAWARQQICR